MLVEQSNNVVPMPLCTAADDHDPLLQDGGPIEGAHAVVIGDGGLSVLCALIRGGAAAAAELQLSDRSPAEPVELAILPNVLSREAASRAISLACRSLLPCGRIVVRVSADLHEDRIGVGEVTSLLRQNGFTMLRTRAADGATVISAERPLFHSARVPERRSERGRVAHG
ncbi:MAG TPA: hypothetical protein VHS58_09035 [Acetobacteraceae bacterium]|jgi:hypothetical protein|nr:hypothetical protein [Acetobacteraceae bacterium]